MRPPGTFAGDAAPADGVAWSWSGVLPRIALLVVLALLVLVSFSRIATHVTSAPLRQVDFFPYWYHGHYLQAGESPFEGYRAGRPPALSEADRRDLAGLDYFPGPPAVPVNTPPLILLLTPLSYLPWNVAAGLWTVSLIVLAGLLPLLTVRTFRLPLSGWGIVALTLFFLTWVGTRWAINNGQTTLLVVAAILASLWAYREQRRLLAGLLLGLALSKYSISLPLLLLMLWRRQWRVVGWALAVQAGGMLLLGLITSDSPIAIAEAYLADFIFILKYGSGLAADSIELRSFLPDDLLLGALVVAAFSVLVVAALGWTTWRIGWSGLGSRWGDLCLLSVLSLWLLLAAYHRVYDSVLALLPVALIAAELNRHTRAGRLVPADRRGAVLLACLLVAGVSLILPSTDLGIEFLTPDWPLIVRGIQMAGLLVLLGASLWLTNDLARARLAEQRAVRVLPHGAPPLYSEPHESSEE